MLPSSRIRRYAWLSDARGAIHTSWNRKRRLCRCSLCCFLCILRDVQNALLGHVDHLKLASVMWGPIDFQTSNKSGWWFQPLWKIFKNISQLEWLFPIYIYTYVYQYINILIWKNRSSKSPNRNSNNRHIEDIEDIAQCSQDSSIPGTGQILPTRQDQQETWKFASENIAMHSLPMPTISIHEQQCKISSRKVQSSWKPAVSTLLSSIIAVAFSIASWQYLGPVIVAENLG